MLKSSQDSFIVCVCVCFCVSVYMSFLGLEPEACIISVTLSVNAIRQI